MESPAHPMDEVLRRLAWKRTSFDDVGDESSALACRLIVRNLTPLGVPATSFVLDVHLWRSGQSICWKFATTANVPPVLQLLAAQGLRGAAPHVLGLTPCNHEPRRWNPFCLPLTWQKEMDDHELTMDIVRLYSRALSDVTWQCPDAARLLR